jgi:hypothetical protein
LETSAESALRDCESRSRVGVWIVEGVMRMVVLAGRARAEERRLRTWEWRRRRERVERRAEAAKVLYWMVERRESVPDVVERMRFRWEIVASVCLR